MQDIKNLRFTIFVVAFILSFLYFDGGNNCISVVSITEKADSSSKYIYNEIEVGDNPTTKKIDSFFSTRYRLGAFSGCVLYSSHDTIYYKNAFGLADRRHKDTLTINSKFSVSICFQKVFYCFWNYAFRKRGKIIISR